MRKSVYTDGLGHKNPIPAASRTRLTVSQGNQPCVARVSRQLHPSPRAESVKITVQRYLEIVEAGGGTTNDIVKITIYLKDHANRAELNDEWQKMFPDPANRLARQAMAGNPNPDQDVECDFVAVIAGASESD